MQDFSSAQLYDDAFESRPAATDSVSKRITSSSIYPSETFYDVDLASKLGVVNLPSALVLNKAFAAWEDNIALCLDPKTRSSMHDSDYRYDRGTDTDLFRKCKAHSEYFRKPLEADTVAFSIYPLYASLSHMGYVNNSTGIDLDKYTADFLAFLCSRHDRPEIRPKVHIAMLETLHHYAAGSSILLEKGYVDEVIFTEYGRTMPLNPHRLRTFKDTDNYIFGQYNSRGIKNFTNILRRFNKNISAISDLIINSPENNYMTLRPERIDCILNSHTLASEDFLKRLESGTLKKGKYGLADKVYDFCRDVKSYFITIVPPGYC